MMNNNQMIKYQPNFISKLKNFFKKLFQKEKYNYVEQRSINEIKNENRNDILKDIKVDTASVDSVILKRKFLEEIGGNYEALRMLSRERLLKLIEYYEDVIIEKIKKLEE